MTRAGLLHTVPALAATFDALISAREPGLTLVHLADARLLRTAIDVGVTSEVRLAVAAHLGHLIASGADAVLVTCSSIGEAAAEAAAGLPVPVIRVDAAMARDAVARTMAASGDRIAVLATNTATLGPTTRLLEREVGATGARIVITASVVDGAVAAREAGQPEEHDRLIAEAVDQAAARGAGVIVLAQASMAAAAAHADTRVPVLTSPEGGVDALLTALHVSEEGVRS